MLGLIIPCVRHILIDFAYAVIIACMDSLMSCESAPEARDCLLNFMISQIELVLQSLMLWPMYARIMMPL
jgi:hypothetical protein